MLLMQTKYNPERFGKPAKLMSLLSLATTGVYSYFWQAQRSHLNKMGLKYFDDYSDEELVQYDMTQRKLMIAN